MKKYKLIKTYPGSPELGAIVENYRDSFWTEVDKAISLTIVDVDKFPEYWEEVVEVPKYVKCIKLPNNSSAIVNKIYKTSLVNNTYFVVRDNNVLLTMVGSPTYNEHFIPTTQEEWDKQEFDKIVQECIKRFPKGSKVKCAYNGKTYTMANTRPDGFTRTENYINDVYFIGYLENSFLAITADSWIVFLYYNGQYAELVEEKKDYEILSFESSIGHLSRNVNGEHIFDVDDNPKLWPEKTFLNSDYKIHSVKRLSDGEVFTVGDMVTAYTNIPDRIIGFGVVSCDVKGGKLDAFATFKNIANHGLSLDSLKHVKKPLFTTEDGVGIFKDDDYYTVFHDVSNDGIKPFVVYGPHKATHTSGGKWAPDVKVFATKEAAENYTLYNAPRLSLNDVYNALPPRPGEETLIDLVKSKLQIK